MRQRFLTARHGITVLLVMLLSLCLALGVLFAVSGSAYADGENDSLEEVEGGETGNEGGTGNDNDSEAGEDENEDDGEKDDGINEWLINPILASWTEGEFDKDVNVISANPKYGADEMYFMIFGYQTIGSNQVFKWYDFDESIEVNGSPNYMAFRLNGDDRSIPDYVCDFLGGLEAGTYYLLAIVPQTDDYTGLNTNATGTEEAIKSVCSPFKVYVKTEYNSLSITEWEYGKFEYRTNVISADIKVDESLKVTYSVLTSDNKRVDGLSAFTISAPVTHVDAETGEIEVVSAGGVVNETAAREAFKNLEAGDYWLVAYVNAHAAEEPFRVAFKVLPYSNSWVIAPSVVGWTWGEYNLNVNLIRGYAEMNDNGKEMTTVEIPVTDSQGNPVLDSEGKPIVRIEYVIDENSRAAVYFGIYTDDETAYSDTLAKFTVGESGIVNIAIAEELKTLPAGNYLLKCWIENDNPNYLDLSETVELTVKQIANAWSISPYVLSWKYGEFDRDLNTIKSEAVLGTKTQYAIYKDEDCTQAVLFNGSEWFELDSEGLVPASVEAVLKSVDAGTYYLTCLVTNDNPNYADLSETVPFAVLKVLNTWVVAPSIISWNEGSFDANENALNGTAKAGSIKFSVYDDKDNLLYIIIKSESGYITSVTNPAGDSLHVSVLNKLGVGSYKLVAEVESTDNYSTLTTESYFAVFEDSVALGGIIAAAATFAVVDVIAAAVCVTLLILRRRKVEKQFRNMVRKELGRR